MGVSESSVKRWIDEGHLLASRTTGRHRRIPLAEAIRFVRSQRSSLVNPELLGLPDLNAVAGNLTASNELSDQLFQFLVEGQASRARGLVLSMFLAGQSVAEMADGPLLEALTRIGDLWKHSPEGVFVEHRASDICLQAVNQLRLLIDPPESGPVAVGGAPAGDPYLLSSLLATCVLREVGMQAVNLGANTPAETMVHAATALKAKLAWLCISTTRDPLKLQALIANLGERLRRVGTTLIVGGQGLVAADLLDSPGVLCGRSMADLASAASAQLARR
jgi:excisionase family DNA binding protein